VYRHGAGWGDGAGEAAAAGGQRPYRSRVFTTSKV
jgi:hypothetical protein